MSRELADGLAVTAMTVRMEVSIHAMAGSFALSRQRARRPPRLESGSALQMLGRLVLTILESALSRSVQISRIDTEVCVMLSRKYRLSGPADLGAVAPA